MDLLKPICVSFIKRKELSFLRSRSYYSGSICTAPQCRPRTWQRTLEIKQGHPEPAVPLGFEDGDPTASPGHLPQQPTIPTAKNPPHLFSYILVEFTKLQFVPTPDPSPQPWPSWHPWYPAPKKSHLKPNSCPAFLQKRRKTQVCEARATPMRCLPAVSRGAYTRHDGNQALKPIIKRRGAPYRPGLPPLRGGRAPPACLGRSPPDPRPPRSSPAGLSGAPRPRPGTCRGRARRGPAGPYLKTRSRRQAMRAAVRAQAPMTAAFSAERSRSRAGTGLSWAPLWLPGAPAGSAGNRLPFTTTAATGPAAGSWLP